MFCVYILVSDIDGSLYTGQTRDLEARLKLHNAGGVRSTKAKRPWKLGYCETFLSRAAAMRREKEFKDKWSTPRKKRLVAGFLGRPEG